MNTVRRIQRLKALNRKRQERQHRKGVLKAERLRLAAYRVKTLLDVSRVEVTEDETFPDN